MKTPNQSRPIRQPKGQLKDALATLSVFTNSAELTESQRSDLVDFLDALAAQVIYSTEHYLDLPYTSAAGETLDQIARRYQIPTEVFSSHKGLEPTAVINAGTKLKVSPGPFRAEVDLKRNELTLFLGELNASRFPISTGSDPNPQLVATLLLQKTEIEITTGRAPIMATDANNPYGGYLIDLATKSVFTALLAAATTNWVALACPLQTLRMFMVCFQVVRK